MSCILLTDKNVVSNRKRKKDYTVGPSSICSGRFELELSIVIRIPRFFNLTAFKSMDTLERWVDTKVPTAAATR